MQLDDEFHSFNFDYRIAGDVRDPYPALAAAREHAPVERVANMLDPDGPPMFMVYGHAEVTKLFKDNATFSSSNLRDTMGPAMGDYIILGMDEPEHRRHRALVSTAFRQRALARWEEKLVRQVVDDLVDGFADRGHADLVPEFTFLFPSQVVAGVLGLPREDFRQFQKWALAIISLHADWDNGIIAAEELKAYLARVLEERRRDPHDDVISDLASVELDGERLDDEEIFSFLRLLLPAGVETTFRSSGNLLHLLLTHPEQLDAVRRDRSLLPQAIEEGLRFEPPLLLTARIVLKDTELSGVPIPAGSTVTPMLGAANRDPSVFADPDRFDIFRDPHQHISFGHGVHVCLGMHLARMETRVAIDRLLDRLPNLRLDVERAQRDDAHIHGEVFRSATALPVVWDVA
ncbi:MAG: cytochrome P450 [Acidimicrobiales bacterium]